jgi:hypothetical protein
MGSARSYARHRHGDIEFAVRTQHHYWGYRDTHVLPSASVIKAMLLVAYLDLSDVRDRALNDNDKHDLAPMIQRSDDNAAWRVFDRVGFSGLRRLAKRVGMTHFKTGEGAKREWGCSNSHWGCSSITAQDQTRFFLRLDAFIIGNQAASHRSYALHLLSSIVDSQRWGIWQERPSGWRLYAKGGWGRGTGWVDHQASLLLRDRDGERVSVAVLTHNDGSHSYGKDTLRGLAHRLLKGLDANSAVD